MTDTTCINHKKILYYKSLLRSTLIAFQTKRCVSCVFCTVERLLDMTDTTCINHKKYFIIKHFSEAC